MVKDAEAHAAEDRKRKETVEARNSAEALLHGTEKAVAEHGGKLSEADRSAIENAMANLREAVKSDDGPAISAKAGVLQQHAMKLAEAAQSAASQASPEAEAGTGRRGDDNVVDAEFTEIDDDKK
jgi:molecular chaperone DnaK